LVRRRGGAQGSGGGGGASQGGEEGVESGITFVFPETSQNSDGDEVNSKAVPSVDHPRLELRNTCHKKDNEMKEWTSFTKALRRASDWIGLTPLPCKEAFTEICWMWLLLLCKDTSGSEF